jgi:hypothetical protein
MTEGKFRVMGSGSNYDCKSTYPSEVKFMAPQWCGVFGAVKPRNDAQTGAGDPPPLSRFESSAME